MKNIKIGHWSMIQSATNSVMHNIWNKLTLWRLVAFGNFWKKTPKRKWLCTGISLVR